MWEIFYQKICLKVYDSQTISFSRFQSIQIGLHYHLAQFGACALIALIKSSRPYFVLQANRQVFSCRLLSSPKTIFINLKILRKRTFLKGHSSRVEQEFHILSPSSSKPNQCSCTWCRIRMCPSCCWLSRAFV